MRLDVSRCLQRLYGADPRSRTESKVRMCSTKVRHADKDSAESRAAFHEFMRGVPLRVYPCPHCKGWHITKKEQLT